MNCSESLLIVNFVVSIKRANDPAVKFDLFDMEGVLQATGGPISYPISVDLGVLKGGDFGGEGIG